MPSTNHSGCLLCMPINPVLGSSTRRSQRQHMQRVHKVENRSWLIDPKATALYILLLSRDPGNYWHSAYIWNNRLHSGVHVGAQLNLTKLDHIRII